MKSPNCPLQSTPHPQKNYSPPPPPAYLLCTPHSAQSPPPTYPSPPSLLPPTREPAPAYPLHLNPQPTIPHPHTHVSPLSPHASLPTPQQKMKKQYYVRSKFYSKQNFGKSAVKFNAKDLNSTQNM